MESVYFFELPLFSMLLWHVQCYVIMSFCDHSGTVVGLSDEEKLALGESRHCCSSGNIGLLCAQKCEFEWQIISNTGVLLTYGQTTIVKSRVSCPWVGDHERCGLFTFFCRMRSNERYDGPMSAQR